MTWWSGDKSCCSRSIEVSPAAVDRQECRAGVHVVNLLGEPSEDSSRTTSDYTVVMAVVSIRFSDEPLHGRLKESARRRGQGVSPLAERLIDEGLRMDAHPAVLFRDGPAGRRAVLVGGPEVVDVIGGLIGGDVPAAQRRSRAAEMLGLSEAMVDAALAYYAEFTDEIDAALAERARAADEAEAAWARRQALLET